LEYTDYLNGNCVGLKFDVTNNTDMLIDRFRPEIFVSFDEISSVHSQTFYPDVHEALAPGETERSLWISVGCGSVWYGGYHDIREVLYWDQDDNEYSFQHDE